jgi:uncharacterized protein (DUF433 family)
MNYRERITLEPGKRGGKPCVRGLRITVDDVLDQLAVGLSVEQIIEDFPELEPGDIRACLQFAAESEQDDTEAFLAAVTGGLSADFPDDITDTDLI